MSGRLRRVGGLTPLARTLFVVSSVGLVARAQTAAPPNYDAITNSAVPRLQIESIDAVLRGYLADEQLGSGSLAESAFSYGPIATIARPVPPGLAAALIAASQNDDARVRREALFTLGAISAPLTPEETASLAALLRHDDPRTRETAAAVAGRLRLKSAGDALIEAINDRDPRVKASAMRAIGQVRDVRAVQSLNDQFAHYKRGDLATAAFEGLAGIGHGSNVPEFETALRDRDDDVRRLAAEGLGRSGNSSSVTVLEAALAKERDPFPRLAMAFALSMLGQRFQHRLVEALREPLTAPQAFAYLVELAPGSRSTLQSLLRDPEVRLRVLAQRALDRIDAEQATTRTVR
jgi:HEAT repeat protein